MTVNEADENVEPDYVLVVKDERGDFILKQLEKVDIKFQTFISKSNSSSSFTLGNINPDNKIIVLYFPQDILEQMAELSDMRCKLKDSNYLHQFKIYARDLFENF